MNAEFVQLNLSIPAQYRETFRELARRQHRSMAEQFRYLVSREARAEGLPPIQDGQR
jgi:hypothetical protein